APRHKHLVLSSRAAWRGKFERLGIDHRRLHAFWRIEVLHVTVAGQRGRSIHEISPNRRRGRAPGQTQVAVVVESDPNHANKIRCETGKPAIARSSGFARSGQRKSASPNACTGAAIEHILQHARHKVGDSWIEHLTILRRYFFERGPVRADNFT